MKPFEKLLDLIKKIVVEEKAKTQVLLALEKDCCHKISQGSDAEQRPIFVGLQAKIEQALALLLGEGEINVIGVIHTPQPATPLCTGADPVTLDAAVAPEIRTDPRRLQTVLTRQEIIRAYLAAGGVLVAAYDANCRSGPQGRSEAQLQIFEALKQQHPHLLDYPLTLTSEFPLAMSGATYVARDREGNECVFSIRAYQAKTPKDGAPWGLWLGPKDHPAIQLRFKEVGEFLANHGLSLDTLWDYAPSPAAGAAPPLTPG
jgi:hypothetical protein